ncbi:hypothetical protein D3C72_1497230 [compost metagenome]
MPFSEPTPRTMKSPNISDSTKALMAMAASTRGPIIVLARQRRAASSQPSSKVRFSAAMIRLGSPVPSRMANQVKTRSPSHRATAIFSTRAHNSHTAWLAEASAQGSSRTAHQANNSQVSAPVW